MKKIILPLSKSQNNPNNIVISSKVSIVRNIDALLFPHKLSDVHKEQIEQNLSSILEDQYQKDFSMISFKESDQSYKNQISSDFIINQTFFEYGHTFFTCNKGTWILLPNTRDHFTVYSVEYGLRLKHIYSNINSVVCNLDSSIHFAYTPDLGFLTSDVTHLGNGLYLSVLLNLTGLELQNTIGVLTETSKETGYLLKPYMTQQNSGLFLLQNISSFGISELDHIEHMNQFIQKIQASEFLAKQELFQDNENIELFMLQITTTLKQSTLTYDEMIHFISLVDFLDNYLYKIHNKEEWLEQIFRLKDYSPIFTNIEYLEEINSYRMTLVQHAFNQLVKYKQ